MISAPAVLDKERKKERKKVRMDDGKSEKDRQKEIMKGQKKRRVR